MWIVGDNTYGTLDIEYTVEDGIKEHIEGTLLNPQKASILAIATVGRTVV